MSRRSRSSGGGENMVMTDIVLGMLVVGLLVAAMVLPWINEPPKDVAEKRTPTEPTALYIEVEWQDGTPHDVDLYVRCDSYRGANGADSYTVNYRQRHAGFLDLTWDDLGKPSVPNYERVISNSQIEKMPRNTACLINVHLYSVKGGSLPLEGKLRVILDKDGSHQRSLTSEKGLSFQLFRHGEELTLLSVVWDEEGHLIPEAVARYPNIVPTCIATKRCKQ